MTLGERDEARFWSKVALPNEQGCMLWTAGTRRGYPIFHVSRMPTGAHRVAYELRVSSIPPGWEVDHVKARGCTSTLCVAPDHLEAVTGEENNRRSSSASSVNSRKTHCPQGHPYVGENLITTPQGWRRCRICRRREVKERRRAAAQS